MRGSAFCSCSGSRPLDQSAWGAQLAPMSWNVFERGRGYLGSIPPTCVFCETSQCKMKCMFQKRKQYETEMSTCESDYLEWVKYVIVKSFFKLIKYVIMKWVKYVIMKSFLKWMKYGIMKYFLKWVKIYYIKWVKYVNMKSFLKWVKCIIIKYFLKQLKWVKYIIWN